MLSRWFDAWRQGRRAWRGLNAFNAAPRAAKRIVVYAETAADWAYLGPISSALEGRGVRILKIASDPKDPVLQKSDSFYVGFGFARTALFKTISADAFVMTLPDLETYFLKRSINTSRYFYVFHSVFSTHCVYQEHAFDAYDTILCVGPHHVAEIRETEAVYQLKPKCLREHGYGRLDALIADMRLKQATVGAASDSTPRVLLAPTWGDSSIVKHCLDPLIRTLLQARLKVTLRLHPMTRRYEPNLANRLTTEYVPSGFFRLDPHISTTDSLVEADVMITDWSGSSMDYAFSRERPVIFVDTPMKVKNVNYTRISAPPLEVAIREKIGRVVPVDQVPSMAGAVRDLVANAARWGADIGRIRDQSVYNVGRSAEVGANLILEALPAAPGVVG